MSVVEQTMNRLDDQIFWYNNRSLNNQRMFKCLKIGEIIAASIIPFCAGINAPAIVTGGLGVLIVIFEGLQQLNQYHNNWITYRSTCEELKHEKYLYSAKAGPYVNSANIDALLAERVESLISREHAKWVSGQEKVEKIKN